MQQKSFLQYYFPWVGQWAYHPDLFICIIPLSDFHLAVPSIAM